MEEKSSTLVVFGDAGAGKTSFIARLVDNIFLPEQPSTTEPFNTIRFIEGRKCYIWDLPSDGIREHSSAEDCGSDSQLLINTAFSKEANLFVFVWDASKPAPIKEFYNRLYWMRERGISIKTIPFIFVACKADIASAASTPKEIDEKIVKSFELEKVRYISTSAKENRGFDKCVRAIDESLLLSHQTQLVHALKLNYQASRFAHTRAPRFAQLNSSDIAKKDPTELTKEDVDWLLLNWKSINDRKSTVSLWIEKRLACKFGFYTDPTQPYTEQHRQQFNLRIQAKKTEEEEHQEAQPNSQQELQPLTKTNFADTQEKLQKVHLLLAMLAAYETSKLVKLGCFFFACYRAKINQFKIGLMATAKFLYDASIQNKTEQEVNAGISQEWSGEIPKEVGRIVGLAR